jgi:argininosuccinate lyase
VLWMSPRFGFIRLPDRFTTGSSIMPQKKNPDVPELARGKSGRVTGHLVSLLMLMKGQPLAYNKDNQEDKEPLFDTVDTLRDTLRAFIEMVPGIEVDPAAMRAAAEEGFATATDLADYLVKRGLPFRDAHEAVARAVRLAQERGCTWPPCRWRTCSASRRRWAKTWCRCSASTARWQRATTSAAPRRSRCCSRQPRGALAWRADRDESDATSA